MTSDHAQRPSYTITDAAKLTGVSRSTIRRRREGGKFPNAFRNREGEWLVPLTDLLAIGLRPVSSERVHLEEEGLLTPLPQPTAPAQPDTELLEALHQAQLELAAERARAAGLEQTLAATQSNVIDLRKAMAMLEAPKPRRLVTPEDEFTGQPAPTPPPSIRRDGFWKWLTASE
jgi:Helix-turn-helix domain